MTDASSRRKDGFDRDKEIVVACRNTDATNALIRGVAGSGGLPLRVVENNNVVAMFAGMLRGDYDASEMSLAEFIYYRSRGEADFIGIPVFPSRVFRHGYLWCNKAAGIETAVQLSGRRIGFLRWVQTAFVWVRGALVEDYGVSRADTQWFVNSLHHWQDGADHGVAPRDGSTIRILGEKPGMDEYERICEALIEGELDAIAITENRRYFDFLAGNDKVRRLFPAPRKEEAEYFRRTGVYPIMHVLVVREAALATHPGLGEKLFELFSESKRLGRAWAHSTPSLTLAWKDEYLEEERAILGSDPCRFGLEENRRVLNRFLGYCYEEGIAARRMEAGELFARETWSLREGARD